MYNKDFILKKEVEPVFLSILPGEDTAWALSILDGDSISGTWKNNSEKDSIRRFENWLNVTYKGAGHIYMVCSEKPPGGIRNEWQSALSIWCRKWNIPYKEVSGARIRKYITGDETANPETLMDMVNSFGPPPHTEKEALALGLLHFARKELM